ncbi:MAG: LysR family transcriptional regulator, partial [Rubrobacteraceae bacterium]
MSTPFRDRPKRKGNVNRPLAINPITSLYCCHRFYLYQECAMLFRQMECFLAVARLGNVSRAAEEMFLTQPTLTARRKSREE